MEKKITSIIFLFFAYTAFSQQLSIARIDKMPNMPSPYSMRSWKQVAIDYDNFIFDGTKTGTYLPIGYMSNNNGNNYSDVKQTMVDTYVGQTDHGLVSEGINVLPAIVGASLVGVNKTNHLGYNWVTSVKDFFNARNGQLVYLNGPSSKTGIDWWYEVMPNVFFYQLYSLYPNVDPDFKTQFTSIADRQIGVLTKLGAKPVPWTSPNLDYRAFDLITGLPSNATPHEPEAAGSIAWLLYQAYKETGNSNYLKGAQWALDFLQNFSSNPSYEIQLPYGILTAARMNAEEGTNYNLQKLLDWTFSSGAGTIRGWGTIVGNWGGYDVSGLIGEANDKGKDYAFSMNGFQHAAALAPVAKYDKRYARALAKWILNLANASRLFYRNGLPQANQESASYAWSNQYDSNACIPFESIKQVYSGKNPLAMGDAIGGKWASTDLSLYSGSSVGYLAALINTTNVAGVLQIDLNKTDFRAVNPYPTYLYYNPTTVTQNISLVLPTGNFDVYDAISETAVATNVSSTTIFSIAADGTRLLVIYPTGQSIQLVNGRIRKVYQGSVIDYHYKYNYTNLFRIKSFASDQAQVVSGGVVNFNCLVENPGANLSYAWYINGAIQTTTNSSNFEWTTPNQSGIYKVKCIITSGGIPYTSDELSITVAPKGVVAPKVTSLNINGTQPYDINSTLSAFAVATITTNETFNWNVTGGSLTNSNTLNPTWSLPSTPGMYQITLTVNNVLGSDQKSAYALVKNINNHSTNYTPIIFYPFNGNTNNHAQNLFDAINFGAVLTSDYQGNPNSAYKFTSSNAYIYTPNANALNFTDKVAISFWIKPDILPSTEQFVISHGSYEQRYKVSIIIGGILRWTLNSSNGIVDVDDVIPLTIGTFTHFMVQYTGYSMEIYRNGILTSYKPLSGLINTSTKSITIARKDETTTNYTFIGTIDEVRIYNAELPLYYSSLIQSMVSLNTGITDIDYQNIGIYPCPFKSTFSVRFPTNGEEFNADIFTTNGQKAWAGENLQSNTPVCPNLKSNGIYLLKIITKSGIQYFSKINKQ